MRVLKSVLLLAGVVFGHNPVRPHSHHHEDMDMANHHMDTATGMPPMHHEHFHDHMPADMGMPPMEYMHDTAMDHMPPPMMQEIMEEVDMATMEDVQEEMMHMDRSDAEWLADAAHWYVENEDMHPQIHHMIMEEGPMETVHKICAMEDCPPPLKDAVMGFIDDLQMEMEDMGEMNMVDMMHDKMMHMGHHQPHFDDFEEHFEPEEHFEEHFEPEEHFEKHFEPEEHFEKHFDTHHMPPMDQFEEHVLEHFHDFAEPMYEKKEHHDFTFEDDYPVQDMHHTMHEHFKPADHGDGDW